MKSGEIYGSLNSFQLCSNMHFLLKIHFSLSQRFLLLEIREWQNLIKIPFPMPFSALVDLFNAENLWLTIMTSFSCDFLSFPVKQSATGRDYDFIVSSNYRCLFTQWATEVEMQNFHPPWNYFWHMKNKILFTPPRDSSSFVRSVSERNHL